jgi:hypothetical protein
MNSNTSILGLIVIPILVCLAGCSSEDDPIVAPPLDQTTLDTQAKIDAFGAEGHTDYADRLVIGVENRPNGSITNLDALSGLTSVKGLAVIAVNGFMTYLGGLENLETLGGVLIFLDNPHLANYCGSQHLLSVGFNGISSAVGNATDPTLPELQAAFRD